MIRSGARVAVVVDELFWFPGNDVKQAYGHSIFEPPPHGGGEGGGVCGWWEQGSIHIVTDLTLPNLPCLVPGRGLGLDWTSVVVGERRKD